MATFEYPTWSAGTYAVGDRVQDNGVLYQALTARTSSDTTRPSLDRTNWKLAGIIRIQNRNALYEAIRFEINVNNDMIDDSAPFFVQLAEESFQTRIRAPIQRSTVTLTTDSQGRIEVPEDLLEVINVRIMDNAAGSDEIMDNMRIEILAAGSQEEYLRLREGYNSYRFRLDAYRTGVYWYDDRYFKIAPVLDAGTEIELQYYAKIPQLGSTVNLVNQNGQPINSAGQTVDQWVAAGNTPGSFEQATDTVDVNWFITAAPQMLLYGAILNAESYLKDDERLPMWQQRFQAAEAETINLIERFQDNRPQFIADNIANVI